MEDPLGVWEKVQAEMEGEGLDVDQLIATEKRAEEDKIRFTAAVWKVSTLADGGIRLVLDLEEGARIHMPELARCQQNGIVLEIEAEKDD